MNKNGNLMTEDERKLCINSHNRKIQSLCTYLATNRSIIHKSTCLHAHTHAHVHTRDQKHI